MNQNAKVIRGMFAQMGCSAQFQSGRLHEVLRHLYGICSSSVMPVHPLMFPGLVTDDEAFLRKVYRVVARMGDGTVGALREYGHELYPRVRAHVVGLLSDCHEEWARHEICFFSLVASSRVFEHVVPRVKQGYFRARSLQEELEIISEVSIVHALYAILTHPTDPWFEEGFCARLAVLVKGCLDSCFDDAEGGAFRAVSQRVLLLMWWSRNAHFYVTALPSVNLVFLERCVRRLPPFLCILLPRFHRAFTAFLPRFYRCLRAGTWRPSPRS